MTIKIGHIIDSETKGEKYCETFQGVVTKNEIVLPVSFECAVMEFDNDRAIAHVDTVIIELTPEMVEGKSIRDALEIARGV